MHNKFFFLFRNAHQSKSRATQDSTLKKKTKKENKIKNTLPCLFVSFYISSGPFNSFRNTSPPLLSVSFAISLLSFTWEVIVWSSPHSVEHVAHCCYFLMQRSVSIPPFLCTSSCFLSLYSQSCSHPFLCICLSKN